MKPANVMKQNLIGMARRYVTGLQEPLKQNAGCDTQGLKNEIASTQRSVVKSAKSVWQVACEFDLRQQASCDLSVTTP